MRIVACRAWIGERRPTKKRKKRNHFHTHAHNIKQHEFTFRKRTEKKKSLFVCVIYIIIHWPLLYSPFFRSSFYLFIFTYTLHGRSVSARLKIKHFRLFFSLVLISRHFTSTIHTQSDAHTVQIVFNIFRKIKDREIEKYVMHLRRRSHTFW